MSALKISEERYGSSPTPENQEEFELLKMEYDSIYEQIWTDTTCYEKEEKLEQQVLFKPRNM